MYVTAVPNRGGKPTVLLRESYREDGKVKNRTLANLSKLPPDAIDAVQRILRGEQLVASSQAFEIERSLKHGHADAVITTIRRIGLDRVLAARRCRERDLALAMIASRILAPASKLSTSRWLGDTTLVDTLDLEGVGEDELYRAMDWLVARQGLIEKKLAKRPSNPAALSSTTSARRGC